MRILLDTSVVIGLSDDPHLFRPDVVERLRAESTTLLLSSVVPWEVAIKWRTGRLQLDLHPREWTARLVRELGTQGLTVSFDHATRVADLPDHHRDPFDRLLIAQAQAEDVPIVTADRAFAQYDVEVITAR